ncbi:MAG: ABC transporter ATP-binding protein [Proteobacteria bacterium]|nr:ABC transporter ATP-binding protein [Pseudomonadota bacterium]
MADAAASLEVAEVEVHYGSLRVLDRISLAVEGGQFVALLGASGCGKTTLLRAICGFVPVTGGRIAVGGRDITGLPPDKRDMAMVFQSYALWPHMTVAQNIGYGLKLRGADRATIALKIEQMLSMLRLGGLAGRRVTELSGGQRQRVALGRALVISPQILLLDEPLSNLDARIREDVRHEIRTLQRALGITTVHVTHDREEAMVMADRIVILDKGRIVQMGTPEEIYNRPNSPFVADFMGASNVVRLAVRPANGGIAIEPGPNNGALALAGPQAAALARAAAVRAHFRGEAAQLHVGEIAHDGELVLRGRIAQASYPGGVWRYSVQVGNDHFLVDDPRRLEVGAAVGIGLAAEALHLYAAEP